MNIDQFFKGHFDNASESPPSAAWDALQQRLAERGKKRRVFWWLFNWRLNGLILLLCLTAGSAYYFKSDISEAISGDKTADRTFPAAGKGINTGAPLSNKPSSPPTPGAPPAAGTSGGTTTHGAENDQSADQKTSAQNGQSQSAADQSGTRRGSTAGTTTGPDTKERPAGTRDARQTNTQGKMTTASPVSRDRRTAGPATMPRSKKAGDNTVAGAQPSRTAEATAPSSAEQKTSTASPVLTAPAKAGQKTGGRTTLPAEAKSRITSTPEAKQSDRRAGITKAVPPPAEIPESRPRIRTKAEVGVEAPQARPATPVVKKPDATTTPLAASGDDDDNEEEDDDDISADDSSEAESLPEPRARIRVNRFTFGAGVGYEPSLGVKGIFAVPVNLNVSYDLGSGWGLTASPGARYEAIKGEPAKDGSTFYRNSTFLVDTSSTFVPDSLLPGGGTYTYHYVVRERYDSLSTGSFIRAQSRIAAEMPTLLKKKLSDRITLGAGAILRYSRTYETQSTLTDYGIRTITFDTLSAPAQLQIPVVLAGIPNLHTVPLYNGNTGIAAETAQAFFAAAWIAGVDVSLASGLGFSLYLNKAFYQSVQPTRDYFVRLADAMHIRAALTYTFGSRR